MPVDTLSKKELKNIFLGKRTQWDGGQKVITTGYAGGNDFSRDIDHKFD